MENNDFTKLRQQWRELEASGIPLEPMEYRVGGDARNSASGLTIRIGRDHLWSEIRELKNGSFAYILPVFIRRDHPGKTTIRDVWLTPPWDDLCVELLEDPKDSGRNPGWYAFPGDTERFERERVLNHRINCVLSRGDIREGLLLAIGSRPPEIYTNHQIIELIFGILDEWDRQHTAKLQMQLSRRSARAKMIHKSSRIPLFSRRDVPASARSLVAPPAPTTESLKKDEVSLRQTRTFGLLTTPSVPPRIKLVSPGNLGERTHDARLQLHGSSSFQSDTRES